MTPRPTVSSARIVSGQVVGPALEIVNYTDDAEWVLRDDQGDVTVFEESSPLEYVEVRCDTCGRWARSVVPSGAGWVCVVECRDA